MPQCLQQYLGSFFCHDITNVNAANSEMFRVNTFVNFSFFSGHRGENKQAAEEILSFPSLKLSKHEIVWKPHTTFFNRARDDSKEIHCHKSVLCTKRENWYYLTYNCYRPLRRECGIACMNLNSRTDYIMLAMLERMRVTYCVLAQGKALNARV